MTLRSGYDDYAGYDLNRIIVRSLYFGLLTNIIVPAVLLYGCFYLSGHRYMPNRLGEAGNWLYYVLVVISLLQGGLAVWWRQKRYARPMIRTQESMEQDLAQGLLVASRPVFVLIAAVSLWGCLYFLLTGRFNESVFLVLLSYLIFLVVRPRYGSLKRFVDRQQELFQQKTA